jgi:hypothetical protein
MATSVIPKSLASDVATVKSDISALKTNTRLRYGIVKKGETTLTTGNPAFLLISDNDSNGAIFYLSGGAINKLAGNLLGVSLTKTSANTVTVTNNNAWDVSYWAMGTAYFQ